MRAYIIDADLPEELYMAIEPHIVGEVPGEGYICHNGAERTPMRTRIRSVRWDEEKGTYISADNAKVSVRGAVQDEIRSMKKGVDRLRDMLREAVDDGEGTIEDFLYLNVSTKSNFTHDLSDEAAVNVMLALCGFGKLDFGGRSELSTAKLVSSILGVFGFTPVGLVDTLYKYSWQRYRREGLNMSFAQTNMCDYGYVDEEFQEHLAGSMEKVCKMFRGEEEA